MFQCVFQCSSWDCDGAGREEEDWCQPGVVLERLGVWLGAMRWSGRQCAAGVGDADSGLALVREVSDGVEVCWGELDVVVELDPDVLVIIEEELGGPAPGPGDQSVFADGP